MSANMYDAAVKASKRLEEQTKEFQANLDTASQFVTAAQDVKSALNTQKEAFIRTIEKIRVQKEADKKRYKDEREVYRDKTNQLIGVLKREAEASESELKKYIEEDQLIDTIGYGFGATSTLVGLAIGSQFYNFSDVLSVAGLYLPFGIGVGQNFSKEVGSVSRCCSKPKEERATTATADLSDKKVLQNNHVISVDSKVDETVPGIAQDAGSVITTATIATTAVTRSSTATTNSPVTTQISIPRVDDLTATAAVAVVAGSASTSYALRMAMQSKVAATAAGLDKTIKNAFDFVAETEKLTRDLVLQKRAMDEYIEKIEIETQKETEADDHIFREYKKAADETERELRKRLMSAREKLKLYLEKLKLKKSTGIKVGLLVATPIAVAGCIFSSVLPTLSVASFSYSAGNALGRWASAPINRCWNWITCTKRSESHEIESINGSGSPTLSIRETIRRSAEVNIDISSLQPPTDLALPAEQPPTTATAASPSSTKTASPTSVPAATPKSPAPVLFTTRREASATPIVASTPLVTTSSAPYLVEPYSPRPKGITRTTTVVGQRPRKLDALAKGSSTKKPVGDRPPSRRSVRPPISAVNGKARPRGQ